ncbi:hypothetical protein C8J57DRAFT_1516144 [Mycena rebaudengoi]|nr:hypothetical protein C8J57DRAFT_1516144 [Mycena rebaudengoi]
MLRPLPARPCHTLSHFPTLAHAVKDSFTGKFRTELVRRRCLLAHVAPNAARSLLPPSLLSLPPYLHLHTSSSSSPRPPMLTCVLVASPTPISSLLRTPSLHSLPSSQPTCVVGFVGRLRLSRLLPTSFRSSSFLPADLHHHPRPPPRVSSHHLACLSLLPRPLLARSLSARHAVACTMSRFDDADALLSTCRRRC